MRKTIMAKLSEMNMTAREVGAILLALAGFVGYIINTQTSAARTEESVLSIKSSILEIKEDQKEIRMDIKLTNDRIDRVITLKN